MKNVLATRHDPTRPDKKKRITKIECGEATKFKLGYTTK